MINLSKYGTFPADQIIGRPYFCTYEIPDKKTDLGSLSLSLRIVPPAELYANVEEEDEVEPDVSGQASNKRGEDGVEYDVVGEDGQLLMRTNQNTLDDPNSQSMSSREIEKLRAEGISGNDLVARILQSHSALDQKTAFALAKYTLRKTKKYIKRFTLLPLDVPTLCRWMYYNKDPARILEMREETLALIGSWSNIHYTPGNTLDHEHGKQESQAYGRWLVVDETGGLVVAYMAEKMGLLQTTSLSDQQAETSEAMQNEDHHEEDDDKQHLDGTHLPRIRPSRKRIGLAQSNTIHLIHAASQPNLSLLNYFNFDVNSPSPQHPLSRHLKTLSWLQLLDPAEDAGYTKPEEFPHHVLKTWKSNRRSNYWKKWRRWERIKSVVDEARAGEFDGLIVASVMQPVTVLRELVPLLRGGAQIVVYARSIEPLTELADVYSSNRRTAFIADPPPSSQMPTDDFPVDPTLLLNTSIYTARARAWQVLPGRTHPMMNGRGGGEGFIFTATRALPAQGKIPARGTAKRRKVNGEDKTTTEQSEGDRKESPAMATPISEVE